MYKLLIFICLTHKTDDTSDRDILQLKMDKLSERHDQVIKIANITVSLT